ncbi:MAG: VWA domain-containing protein [Pseudomonadales bacterium]|nr:VWA domain-containing protein [Pseudomonadales bacterium]
MDTTIPNFIAALRKAELEVSPAETLDAINAVDFIGLTDRQLLKDSLALILAKTPDEKQAFGECFDRFFSFQNLMRNPRLPSGTFPSASAATSANPQQSSQSAGTEQHTGNEGASADTHDGQGNRTGRVRAAFTSRVADLLLSGREDLFAVMVTDAARAVHLEKMRTLRERSLYVRRILIHLGMQQLDDEITRLSNSESSLDIATGETLSAVRLQISEAVKDYVQTQFLLFVDATGKRFIAEAVSDTKLTNMQAFYFDEIRETVRKLAHHLARRHTRKRRLRHRGQLDLRRTLRSNLAYDGALFDLKWKQIRVEKPDVFVLCDVSGSVRNVSRFLLTFLYSLSEVLPHVRAFAFSNDLGEVTENFTRYPLNQAIEMSLEDYGKGSTDYGLAFCRFNELCLKDLNSRSTVIVLGDARNNYYEAHPEALKQISQRARQVIWLNPESRDKWREGDAEMRQYLPSLSVAEVCNSLKDLERIVGRVLASAH